MKAVAFFLAMVMIFSPMSVLAEGNSTGITPFMGISVTFDANGGVTLVGNDQRTTGLDGTIGDSMPIPPTRAGFVFVRWNTMQDGSGSIFTGDTLVNAPITVYAQWGFEVRFMGLGAALYQGDDPNNSAHYLPRLVLAGTAVEEMAGIAWPNDPTFAGHDFIGWYNVVTPTGGTRFDGNSEINSSLMLFARWRVTPPVPIASHTVTFNPSGGNIATIATNGIRLVNDGSSINSSSALNTGRTWIRSAPNATRTGMTVEGWYTEPNGGGTRFAPPGAANTVTTISIPWPAGFSNAIITEDITVYAHWVRRVTFNSNFSGSTTVFRDIPEAGGTINADGMILYGAPNSAAHITPGMPPNPTRTGFIFIGWFSEATGGYEFTGNTHVDASRTVFARWESIPTDPSNPPPPITVTFDTTEGAFLDGEVIVTRTVNRAANLTASSNNINFPLFPIREGYIFMGWYREGLYPIQGVTDGNRRLSQTFVSTLHDDITVYARWLPYVTVTFRTINPDQREETRHMPIDFSFWHMDMVWRASNGAPTLYLTRQPEWYNNPAAPPLNVISNPPIAPNSFSQGNVRWYNADNQYAHNGIFRPSQNSNWLHPQWWTHFSLTTPSFPPGLPTPNTANLHFIGWYPWNDNVGQSRFNENTIITGDLILYSRWHSPLVFYNNLPGGVLPQARVISTYFGYSFRDSHARRSTVAGWPTLDPSPSRESAHQYWNALDFEYLGLAGMPFAFRGFTTYQDPSSLPTPPPIWTVDTIPPNRMRTFLFAWWSSGVAFHSGSAPANVVLPENSYRDAPSTGTPLGANMPPDPIWHGHNFRDWNTNPDGSGMTYSETTPINHGRNLFAVWTISVNLNPNGGVINGGPGYTTMENIVNTPLNHAAFLTPPTRENFIFNGWNTARDGSGTNFASASPAVHATMTLYAQWIVDPLAPTHTVTIINNPDGAIVGQSGAGDYVGGEEVTLVAGAKYGFVFMGWTSDDIAIADYSLAESSFYMPAHDVTVTANWEEFIPPTYYTVTINNSPDGTIVGQSGAGSYAEDAEVTLIAGTKYGFDFIGWTSDDIVISVSTPASINFVMPANDIVVTANWEESIILIPPTYYVVTITNNPNGAIAGQSGAGNYTEGAEVTLVAGTKYGFDFIGWTSDDIVIFLSTPASINFVMPANNVVVIANWEETTGQEPPSGGGSGGGGYDGSTSRPAAPLVPAQPPVQEQPQEIIAPPPLITDVHIRYVHGFPDGTFRPQGFLTRAQMAAILFNLTADDEKYLPHFATMQYFSDVNPEHWYAQAINYLASFSILSGYPDGTFMPNQYMTRAELTTAMSMFFSIYGGTNSFTDIAEHWAYVFINSAYNKGWITGYGDNTFRPNNPITRAEAVRIINLALGRIPNPETIHYHITSQIFPDLQSTHWAYYQIMEAAIKHEHTFCDKGLEIWISVLCVHNCLN
ncbi:MAG: InlB B-repeat-containing protein [Defluviitaleaceae bacterium]|nr:InlB B-repeat-containing protein [Defluviitaleaceae bacterium]